MGEDEEGEEDEEDEEQHKANSDDSETCSEEDDYCEELPTNIINKNKGFRPSVSAESLDHYDSEAFTAKVIEKSEEAKERLKSRLLMAFMFENLDEKELAIVIDAMEICEFKAGETVIKQGDSGAVLYVSDDGELDCNILFPGNDEPTCVKTYSGPGQAFGELALLYNAPRAATIVAKTDSTLYSLDRDTFNHIVKSSSVKKTEKNE
jgi:cAMP-dependent protein kinase regulator